MKIVTINRVEGSFQLRKVFYRTKILIAFPIV